MVKVCTMALQVASKDGVIAENSRHLMEKYQHCCAVFNQLRKFRKEGLLCDVNVLSSAAKRTVKAHRVVLMSAKSFDSDYHSEVESASDSDTDDESLPILSYTDEAVFEEAYASEDEITQATNQMEIINSLRRRGECCDVTLQAYGIQYKAHKCVLAASSEYFKIMFTAGMKEKNMQLVKINIDDQADGSHFQGVMDYIYTGEMLLDDENIIPVLCLAMFFQIATLAKLCQTYLSSKVSRMNCCNLYHLAKYFALEELKSRSREIIQGHFPELEGMADDINLLENVDLSKLLRSDDLGQCCAPAKKSEARVLDNVMEWLSHANFQHASELLRNVRFSLIPKQEIESHCQNIEKQTTSYCENVNIAEIESARGILKRALEYHEKLYEQPLLERRNSDLRATGDTWICMDGVLAPEAVKLPSTCHRAKFPTKEQSKGDPSRKIRDPFHSVVVMNGFVYVIGGTRLTSIGYSREVMRYDCRLDSWIQVAPMTEERGDFFACAIGDFLYVFGGRNRRGPTSSCERYDPRQNRWMPISELPEALYQTAGVVENGKVYLSGGFNEYEAVGITLRYDPALNEWEDLQSSLFKDRGYHVLVNDGHGFLWAIGGVDNPFAGRNVWEVERFDVENQMWGLVGEVLAVQPFLSIQRLNAFIDKNGHICVFAVTNIDHSPLLKYNIDENLWETVAEPLEFFEIDICVT